MGVLVNAVRNGSGGGSPAIGGGYRAPRELSTGPVSLLQMQIGLLASAKSLQTDLRQLAASADTSTSSGLQRVLQETTLALLRQPELWVYANVESGSVPFNASESTFNRLSMTERSKLRAEITTNVGGVRNSNAAELSSSGEADATNEWPALGPPALCNLVASLGPDSAAFSSSSSAFKQESSHFENAHASSE